MKYTAVVLTTLMVLLVLWQFKLILLLFLLSLFVAAAIRPFTKGLTARGLPQGAAQLLLYGVGIGVTLLVLLLGWDLLLLEMNSVANKAVIEYESLHRRWQAGAAWQQTAVSSLPAPFSVTTDPDAELEELLPAIVNFARATAGAIGGLGLLLVLSVYWSVDQHRFERLWLSLLPAKSRVYTRDSWRRIETAVGSYLRSQTFQSLFVALFLGVGATLTGLAFPLVLACVAALAAFIPLFGGLITAIFAFFLGALHSQWLGLGLAIYTLILFFGVELFIEPRIWPRERRNFFLTMLVIIPLFEAFWVWGLIIAPPLAAALEALIAQAYQAYIAQRETVVKLADLETRYQRLAQNIAQAQETEEERFPPELQNLSERLAKLLSSTATL